MDEKNFAQRRNAIRAMLEHGAKVTSDPQSFLTRDIFGHKLNHQPPDWLEVMKGVAGAGSSRTWSRASSTASIGRCGPSASITCGSGGR